MMQVVKSLLLYGYGKIEVADNNATVDFNVSIHSSLPSTIQLTNPILSDSNYSSRSRPVYANRSMASSTVSMLAAPSQDNSVEEKGSIIGLNGSFTLHGRHSRPLTRLNLSMIKFMAFDISREENVIFYMFNSPFQATGDYRLIDSQYSIDTEVSARSSSKLPQFRVKQSHPLCSQDLHQRRKRRFFLHY